MADFPLKHSGVTARFVTSSRRESVPTPISKVPYCIIGTSERGPAFVPFSFADKDTFNNFFGESDGTHEAVVLAKELIEKEQPITFVRVLGAGDANPTLGNGKVSKAGFIVGENQLQTSVTDSYIENKNADVDTRSIVVNRSIGSNPFAYEPEDNSAASNSHGRTYFLGCFHEIRGCPVLGRAGINDVPENPNVPAEGSAPILRAVIMAASGVSLSLSSSLTPNNTPGDKGITGNFGSLSNDAGLPVGDIQLFYFASQLPARADENDFTQLSRDAAAIWNQHFVRSDGMVSLCGVGVALESVDAMVFACGITYTI